VCNRETDGQTDILPQHGPRYAYVNVNVNNRFIQRGVMKHLYRVMNMKHLYKQKFRCLYARMTQQKWLYVGLRYVTVSNMLWIKSTLYHLGRSPLRADQNVVTRLVPEVVPHRRCRTVLPISFHRELLSVQQQETA